MAPELSSNWKKLQAQLKSNPSTSSAPKKRPAADGSEGETSRTKRPRVDTRPKQTQKQTPRPPGKPSSTPAATPPRTRNNKMGVAQSSQPVPDLARSTHKITPSLALWAADNDISPEDIAQAYNLGTGASQSLLSSTTTTAAEVHPNAGLTPDLEVGKYVGMDCEMVGVGPGAHASALARVSVVDFHGRQVYDSFVRPLEPVTDWRTHVSGVSPRDMLHARPFAEAQAAVAALIRDRIVVGHDLRHDMQALLLDHPLRLVRDTARYSGFKKYGHGRKPALRNLAREILGVEIQRGQHSSVEDARVAMLLFRRFKSAFDVEHASRFPEVTPQALRPKASAKKTKKKRRN